MCLVPWSRTYLPCSSFWSWLLNWRFLWCDFICSSTLGLGLLFYSVFYYGLVFLWGVTVSDDAIAFLPSLYYSIFLCLWREKRADPGAWMFLFLCFWNVEPQRFWAGGMMAFDLKTRDHEFVFHHLVLCSYHITLVFKGRAGWGLWGFGYCWCY